MKIIIKKSRIIYNYIHSFITRAFEYRISGLLHTARSFIIMNYTYMYIVKMKKIILQEFINYSYTYIIRICFYLFIYMNMYVYFVRIYYIYIIANKIFTCNIEKTSDNSKKRNEKNHSLHK